MTVKFFTDSLEELLKNKIALVLIFLAYGIALAFWYKPDFIISAGGLLLSNLCYFYARNYYINKTIDRDLLFIKQGLEKNYLIALIIQILAFCLMAFLLGLFVTSLRWSFLNQTPLEETRKNLVLIGQVKEFDLHEKGVRLYLDDNYQLLDGKIEKLHLGLIRVNIRRNLEVEDLIGEWIKVRVDLMPPPGRALPNSFNFAEFALFKGIGALGYSLFKPVILEDFKEEDRSLFEELTLSLKKLRKLLVLKIKAAMKEPAAGIIAAMLLGENAQINSEDYYAIRVAGLAHIIAISGMHVVVVVAIAFFLSKALLLYFIPFIFKLDLALYLPVPKLAAFLAILLSTFYVFLAGAPLSAQRALITSSLVLICIIFDKNLDPIKSLLMVAIILLILRPESLFSAGLQMSFAACFSLITAFQMTDPLVAKLKKGQYFIKLGIASLAASLGVAPLIIYHFNQFAPYGLIANLFCVPLSDFIIMPLALLSLLLMPLGLEKFTLIPVEWAIDFMLALARKISFLPYADLYIPSLTKSGLITISMGLLLFFITKNFKVRIFSLIISLLGLTSFEDYSSLQILISPKSFAIRHNLISNHDKNEFIFSSKRSDSFLHEVWMGKIGRDNFLKKSLGTLAKVKKNGIQNCNEKLCFFTLPDSSKGLIYKDTGSFEGNLCKDLSLFINMVDDRSCKGVTSITFSQLKAVHLISFDKVLKITKVSS